jgi:enoyl-CoA hydratase/carnithine racemase
VADAAAPAGTVLVSAAGGIGRIELSRPAKRNALDNVSAALITEALAGFAEDPDVRGIILLGAGGDLSSGADLKDPSAVAPGAVSPRRAMLAALAASPLPVASVVDGWAVGFGAAMAAASYAAVVTGRARFKLPEAGLGSFPADVVDHLAGRMGRRQVADLVLTGRTVTAAEALALGLATDWAGPGEGETVARAVLTAAAQTSRAVVAETLAWLRRERGKP